LGEVISQTPKKFYQGDKYFGEGEYDHIFDVESEGGLILLLPYNNGDNIMEVADRFCAREGFSKAYSS